MAQIKQLKDTTGNFYPVTHKDAIIGLEGFASDKYAAKQWVKDTLSEVELTTSAALNDLNTRLLNTIDTTTIDAMFL